MAKTGTEMVIEIQAQDSVIDSLHSMIFANLEKVRELKKKKKNLNEMIDSVLKDDKTYIHNEKTAKQWVAAKNQTKAEIMKRPDCAKLDAQKEDIDLEIKDIQESLSSYLGEYERLTRSDEIEDKNGNHFKMVKKYKITRQQGRLFD